MKRRRRSFLSFMRFVLDTILKRGEYRLLRPAEGGSFVAESMMTDFGPFWYLLRLKN